MFEKTNHGETPSDPAQEAADNHLEPSQANDPHGDPQGYACRPAMNHDQPWGGSDQGQAEDYTPSWERLSVLRRVCHSALAAGRRYLSWICNTILPRVRAAYARGHGRVYRWLHGAMSRLRRSQLAGIVERHW
ncbi:MAG: hypothetical protein ACYSU2_06385 [Planctomycetota bacterium]|jgi:hypothetical protein